MKIFIILFGSYSMCNFRTWKSFVSRRCIVCGASRNSRKQVERERTVQETTSFAMNLFRGQIKPDEVFPFRDGTKIKIK
jgi:hypothetical protein